MAAAASGYLHRAKRSQRTAKSCGPGAATLASIRSACAGTATVTIKAAHRGEHEGNRKTIARGKPGRFGCTCSSTPVLSLHGDYGRSRRPAFPAPSPGRGTTNLQNPDENKPRERYFASCVNPTSSAKVPRTKTRGPTPMPDHSLQANGERV